MGLTKGARRHGGDQRTYEVNGVVVEQVSAFQPRAQKTVGQHAQHGRTRGNHQPGSGKQSAKIAD
jgi:hypothetical protein